MARRKYHRGHRVPERWCFGMYDVEQEIGVLRFVEDRKQDTIPNYSGLFRGIHKS